LRRVAEMAASILILTGPPGSGKSTVAKLLADGADGPAVHLHTDDFYTSIRKGFIQPWLPQSQRQNEIVVGVIVEAALGFARGGYDVIADGIVGPWFLEPFRAASVLHRIPIDYAVLRPGAAISLERARSRSDGELKDEEAIQGLCRAFADLGPFESHSVDSASQTPAETADIVREKWKNGQFRLM
jgi:chloramphenicol 3-O-phosphotransferase